MKKFLVPVALLLFVFLQACKKSEPDGIKEYVPADIKAMAPYTPGQTVSFRNNMGNVVVAVASIKSTFYNTGVCGSCSGASNPELITCSLTAGSSRFVEFRLNPSSYINLEIFSPLENFSGSKNFNFSVLPGQYLHACAAGGQTCLPSIVLNGRTFTNVLEITGTTLGNNLRKAYHTVSQGLVGFVYVDGTTYSLE